MHLHPARYEDESQAVYQLRRWTEAQALKTRITEPPEPKPDSGFLSRRELRKFINFSHRQCKRRGLYD